MKKKPAKAKPSRKTAPKKGKATTPKSKKPASKKSPLTAKKTVAPSRPPKPVPAVPAPFPWRVALAGERFVGVVDDFFSHLCVIALKLQAALKVGDKIHVRGHTTDMTEVVESLQIDHVAVPSANPGDSIGIKAIGKCRAGDYVYVTEPRP